MPGGYQQGGRNGRPDFERSSFGRNEQQRFQGRGQEGSRNEWRGGRQQAGGRSEDNARQRDNEQMRAGYQRDDWHRQQPTHNVRSEPHWDPNEFRGGQSEWQGRSGQESQHIEEDWRPAQGARSGSWEDDRYAGGPSFEPRNERQGGRHWYDDRSFSGRERWRDEQDDRGYQTQGYQYRDYDQLRGGQRNFTGGISGRAPIGDRFSQGGFGQNVRGQGEQHEGEHEGFGQQLQDAGRRLVGKVKRLVRNPKNYKRSDDRIREDVCDRLALSDEVDPSDVEVAVQNGEVTLTGTVDNRHMKFLAEEIADDVPGVHDVHNQLRVRREQGSATSTNSTALGTSSQDANQRGRNIGRS